MAVGIFSTNYKKSPKNIFFFLMASPLPPPLPLNGTVIKNFFVGFPFRRMGPICRDTKLQTHGDILQTQTIHYNSTRPAMENCFRKQKKEELSFRTSKFNYYFYSPHSVVFTSHFFACYSFAILILYSWKINRYLCRKFDIHIPNIPYNKKRKKI